VGHMLSTDDMRPQSALTSLKKINRTDYRVGVLLFSAQERPSGF